MLHSIAEDYEHNRTAYTKHAKKSSQALIEAGLLDLPYHEIQLMMVEIRQEFERELEALPYDETQWEVFTEKYGIKSEELHKREFNHHIAKEIPAKFPESEQLFEAFKQAVSLKHIDLDYAGYIGEAQIREPLRPAKIRPQIKGASQAEDAQHGSSSKSRIKAIVFDAETPNGPIEVELKEVTRSPRRFDYKLSFGNSANTVISGCEGIARIGNIFALFTIEPPETIPQFCKDLNHFMQQQHAPLRDFDVSLSKNPDTEHFSLKLERSLRDELLITAQSDNITDDLTILLLKGLQVKPEEINNPRIVENSRELER